MKGNELKMLADHMGHDVQIHSNYYRLQTSTVEKTKVARILCAVEEGNVSQFAGKHLESIEVNGKLSLLSFMM